MKTRVIQILAYTLAACLATKVVAAAERIAAFGVWTVYAYQESAGRNCFMTASPQSQQGKYTKRGAPSIFVTRWAGADGAAVNFEAGYDYATNGKAVASIDGKSFDLQTQGDKAWPRNDDASMVQALRAGDQLVIEGSSARGTRTKDIYSLKGSNQAYTAMISACEQL